MRGDAQKTLTKVDAGVDAVHVWAFPVVNGVVGAGQFVAAATLGGSRPDVAAAFGAQFANAGFTRVRADDLLQGLIRNLKLLRRQASLLQLPGQQVARRSIT